MPVEADAAVAHEAVDPLVNRKGGLSSKPSGDAQ
jgi:hypothetical protein